MQPAKGLSYGRIKVTVVILAFLAALFELGQSGARRVDAQSSASDFKNFESPQIHPLAITPDGTRLLAVNSPDERLSVFQLTGGSAVLSAEIPVGLEPVSVAVRNNQEAWVANWLSDSVSVVDLSAGNVVRTIEVGDEPTDVVFAGQQREQAFVCVSGLRQVKVYDPNDPGADPQIITIRGKQPRALARDSPGARVFVSIFESSNNTTIIPAGQVAAAGGPPKPFPKMSKRLPPAPNVGLIVKWNGSAWADETGNTKWTQFVPYTLSDVGLVVIDATTPAARIQSELTGVGTHIGNAVLDSTGARLYVVNNEARNEVRFAPNLRGQFIRNRVSIVNLGAQATAITAVDLNPHINLDVPEGSDRERARSLALPSDIARSADGTLFVAATGSAKVGILDQTGAGQGRIAVGQGPTGLAIDEARKRLYVLDRFDEALSIVDLGARAEIERIPIGSFNPEPPLVRDGRLFIFDGSLSAHGDLACASCHLNGHRDGLAWDLGDPRGVLPTQSGTFSTFHPMKGPMITLSLRGLFGTEPLHWRGDTGTVGEFAANAVTSILGGRPIPDADGPAFNGYIRSLTYPPNPRENLDRTYPNPATGPSAERGRVRFVTGDPGQFGCSQCHSSSTDLGPGTRGLVIQGRMLSESQDFKVPQLRGLYQKLGMVNAGGQQLSGFGFTHDGSFDTLLNLLRVHIFLPINDTYHPDIEAFLLAFDTGLAPAVGLQLTLAGDSGGLAAGSDRVNLLMAQADAANCDLIVKGVYNGEHRGFLYIGGGMFQPDRQNDAPVSWQTLMESAGPGAELTFTGVPVSYGKRLGIDHNWDGKLDGDQ